MTPIAIEITRDTRDNIPNMFLDSGTPAAPPRTDRAASRAPPAPLGRYTLSSRHEDQTIDLGGF